MREDEAGRQDSRELAARLPPRGVTPRRARALLFALLAAAVAASGAAAKADNHDRAAIRPILARHVTLQDKPAPARLRIAAACPAWQAPDAKMATLTDSLRVPAEYRFLDASEPRFAAYRNALARVRPHALVFRDWLAMERVEAALTLEFSRDLDSSRMNVCL